MLKSVRGAELRGAVPATVRAIDERAAVERDSNGAVRDLAAAS